ncbi:hypothetical protein A2975_02095 [Candidatus Woesebacteria bacterium RIFCSPLOWO2_01_FULL_44_14]|uniref:Uncharacterized protein n=1 Tax=Candidatus Woesebacteria bacterium RIFCSPLOWO2_01_FULL_44_14 TaxID=1802525 RepID=A0A1F8BXY2_9BACT|nr:MAG: hypothetical protein A2975_02095 [Candidatus Woesebacteria bacterium RIFCSPLOWO2_01_FULL_44_14]
MPREILKYSQVQRFLTGGGIRSVFRDIQLNYTEMVYAIQNPSNQRVCDDCDKPGRFMHVTMDYKADWSVTIKCADHSPANYFELELRRGE